MKGYKGLELREEKILMGRPGGYVFTIKKLDVGRYELKIVHEVTHIRLEKVRKIFKNEVEAECYVGGFIDSYEVWK